MKKYKYWIPAIVWMLIIFIMSSRQRISVSDVQAINFIFFKTLHVIEYGILFYLIFHAVRKTFTGIKLFHQGIITFFITLFYAVSDEAHQQFVPTREGKLRDVIIDSVGAILIWIIIIYLLPKLRKIRKSSEKN